MDTSPATLMSTMTAPLGLLPGVMIGRSQALSRSWSHPRLHSTRDSVICHLVLQQAVRLPVLRRPGGYTAGAFEYPLKPPPGPAPHRHWRMLSPPVADAHQVALALAAADTDFESDIMFMVAVLA